jgi:hypothetical protein
MCNLEKVQELRNISWMLNSSPTESRFSFSLKGKEQELDQQDTSKYIKTLFKKNDGRTTHSHVQHPWGFHCRSHPLVPLPLSPLALVALLEDYMYVQLDPTTRTTSPRTGLSYIFFSGKKQIKNVLSLSIEERG